ncbi:MAG: NYN domain-containing protein [Deltaproteobacteria bacterium]|nr:NYN domain-containing protein [Deltaproteobacteria bacterium]
MRTYIYIDGFNFYYGAVKDTPYKWLNFKKLFESLLAPVHQILSIKYFTAIVTGKIDPDQPIRQKTFIRALRKFIPEISVYYGEFLSHNVFKPLAYPIDQNTFGKKIKFVNVIKTEEKGSDVNLAVHLLNDAWLDHYDCAVVVSNDSDLAESLRLVKEQHKKKIGLITPGKTHPSRELLKYADFTKRIRKGVLCASQLPDSIPGTTIHKPKVW